MKPVIISLFVFNFALSAGLTAADSAREANDADPVPEEVSLVFAGDVTLTGHFASHVRDDYFYPFRRLDVMRQADVAMVNLENPVTLRGTAVEKEYTFRAHPKYLRVLLAGGVDVVNLANNHIYDYGREGLLDTINYLDSLGIRHVGAGRDLAEARRPVIMKIKGIRLAFLGYYGLKKHSDSHPAGPDEPGTAKRSLTYIKDDIRKVRDSVDVVIVNFHWGVEKEHFTDREYIWYAHKSIDYGANLVIGHHPHVLQGIELYKEGIIAYSLGNFIFGGNSRRYEETALLKVYVQPGDPIKLSAKVLPIELHSWQPRPAADSTASKVLQQMAEWSAIFERSIF